MGLQASYSPLNVSVVCLLILLPLAQQWLPPCMAQADEAAPIPGGISDIAFNALLNDLKGSKFFTGAAVLGYLARPYLRPSVTLLIPTDKSLAKAIDFAPRDYPALIKFHIVEKKLSFEQLRLLPVGTWLPTALPSFGVQVTSNTFANLSLDTAQIISPNLCPSLVSSFISCQGISAILNPNTSNPSNLAPSSSPPIFLSPSVSPTSSPSTPPLSIPPSLSTSPSSSPPSFSPSPSTFPSTVSSSPATPPTSSPPAPLPLAPSPSTSTFAPLLPPLSDSPISSPPLTLPTEPPFTFMEPRFAPEPAPSAAAAAGHMIGAYMMACLGAYMLVLSPGFY